MLFAGDTPARPVVPGPVQEQLRNDPGATSVESTIFDHFFSGPPGLGLKTPLARSQGGLEGVPGPMPGPITRMQKRTAALLEPRAALFSSRAALLEARAALFLSRAALFWSPTGLFLSRAALPVSPAELLESRAALLPYTHARIFSGARAWRARSTSPTMRTVGHWLLA